MGLVGERTHTGKALKLSPIFGLGFAEEFEASLQCSEGQRSTRDDLIQGREYNRREVASTRQHRAIQEDTVQPTPGTRLCRGCVSPLKVTYTKPMQCRGSIAPAKATQSHPRQCRGNTTLVSVTQDSES